MKIKEINRREFVLSSVAALLMPSVARSEPFQDIDMNGHYEWFVDGKQYMLFWSWGEGIVGYLRDNPNWIRENGLVGVSLSELDNRNVVLKRVKFRFPFGCEIDNEYPEVRVTRKWIRELLIRHKNDIRDGVYS